MSNDESTKTRAQIEWERVQHFGANELGDVHREALSHIDDLDATVDAYRVQIATLEKERDDLAIRVRDLDALCEQQTRTIAIWHEKATVAEKDLAVARELLDLRTSERDACRRNLDAARDDHDADAKTLKAERDAAIAAKEAAEARVTVLTTLAEKVDAIRNGIVGMQGFNFSEHGYPLVAALEEAGYPGAGYKIARENLGTLIEQTKAAESRADAAESREHALGVQVVALKERLRLATRLRDFAASPPIDWVMSEDRQLLTAVLEDATAVLRWPEHRLTITRDDGVCLADLVVFPHHGDVAGVAQDRQDCATEIAAALLWSHRRSLRLDAVAAWDAVPGDALATKGGE